MNTFTKQEELQTAKTIISQLGGIPSLKTMIGAYHFVAGGNELTFKFKCTKKANCCRITLNPNDTYTMEFFKIAKSTLGCKKVKDFDGVYGDQLISTFENYTELCLIVPTYKVQTMQKASIGGVDDH